MDVVPFQTLRICIARQKVEDGFPDLVLVVIHLRRVDPWRQESVNTAIFESL